MYAEALRDRVPALSLSVMVSVAGLGVPRATRPMSAGLLVRGLLSVRSTVSGVSGALSLVIVTVKVWVVTPAPKVTVPLAVV